MTLVLRWILPDESGVEPIAAIIGPPGSGGGSGATTYQHTQSSASALWTVNHNLGRWPSAVTVLSAGGVEVAAQVNHVSINQLTVTFAAPFAGLARII